MKVNHHGSEKKDKSEPKSKKFYPNQKTNPRSDSGGRKQLYKEKSFVKGGEKVVSETRFDDQVNIILDFGICLVV